LEHPTGQAQIEGVKGMAVEDLWARRSVPQQIIRFSWADRLCYLG
jgi:hypothetical protein